MATVAKTKELESRARPVAPTVDETKIQGLAGVYYDGTPATEGRIAGWIIERIMPGAFDSFLKSSAECFGLFDHNPNVILGRRSKGTLELTASAAGLEYSIPYDAEDSDHRNLRAKIRRGDVDGSSFTFLVDPDAQRWSYTPSGDTVREIFNFVAINDVGPTAMPVYSASNAEMRGLEIRRANVEALLREAERHLGVRPPIDVEFWLGAK